MKMKKKWIRILALFATLLALPLTGQAEGQQEVLDPARKCSLTIEVGSKEFQADVSFDLYKVAGIEKTTGHDGYQYVKSEDSLTGADAIIEEANELLPKKEEKKEHAAATMKLASEAARLVFEATPENSPVATKPVEKDEEGKAKNVVFGDLDVGLYLVIARGTRLADRNDYFFETTKSDDPKDTYEYMATMAYSEDEIYTFQPMLVTLPGLTPNDNENLPWAYPWEYNYTVDLILDRKYETTPRYATLEIEKNLTDFKEGEGVTFLFSVEATRNGNSVYSQIVPVSFDSTGTNTVTIDQIPVGSDVVIREEYSGIYQQEGVSRATATLSRPGDTAAAGYPIEGTNSITIPNITAGNISIGSGDNETTVSAGNTITVSFTNVYSGSGNNGGSVVNAFNKNEDGGWTLERTYADSNGITRPGSITLQGSTANPEVTDNPIVTDNPENN